MALEEAFAKVIGRQASELERQRLYRIRDALGLAENDAFWFIVMILEHYDSLYRDYPRQIGEESRRTLEEARRAFAAAAEAESAKAQKMLAQRVAETSVEIARKLAERPVGLHRVTSILAVVVLFGAICMTAGFELAASTRPVWYAGGAEGGGRLFAVVLGAPAGWMAFAFLLPAAAYGGKTGWSMAHDVDAASAQKLLGWSLVGLCAVGAASCAVVLWRMLG